MTTAPSAERPASAPSPFPLRYIVLAWAFGFTAAGIYAAIRYVPLAGWTSSDVTAGASAGYPDLQPRLYDSAPENTTVVASAVANRVLGWQVLKTDVPGRTVSAVAPGFLGMKTDEVQIRIEPIGSVSRIVIRSHSRSLPADLGSNARHIRDLQTALDDKLPRLIAK